MSNSIDIVRGLGFMVPLEDFEDAYDLVECDLEAGVYPEFEMGTSGAPTIINVQPEDMIWISPKRITTHVDPRETDGEIWVFNDTLTGDEENGLTEMAREYFGVFHPVFEPFVAISVY